MKKIIGLMIVLVLFLLGWNASTYVVREGEHAIVLQFGKLVGGESEPGLYFRTPFVTNIVKLDKRFLEWNGESNQIPTNDKRFIWVDTYARWRITDPELFFRRVKNQAGAQIRLDDIIDGATRDYVAKHDLLELVRSSNRTLSDVENDPDMRDELDEIKIGRSKITEMILADVQKLSSELGVEVVDVRFKRIDYNKEVRNAVFDRMIAERERIANRYKSEGSGEASRIRGEKEYELNRIQSEAERQAEELRGEADAKTVAIYAEAYNQDVEFYQFLRSMESYPKVFDANTTMMLSTDMDYFKYLKSPSGR